MVFGFIGAIVVSTVLSAAINKIIGRKPEQCALHDASMQDMKDERISLAQEVQDSKKHMDVLTECFHALDKKIDIFIETSKVRHDIIIELSNALKSIAGACVKGVIRHD